jgi:hypothetical protein
VFLQSWNLYLLRSQDELETLALAFATDLGPLRLHGLIVSLNLLILQSAWLAEGQI